jgi:hypothetical protein
VRLLSTNCAPDRRDVPRATRGHCILMHFTGSESLNKVVRAWTHCGRPLLDDVQNNHSNEPLAISRYPCRFGSGAIDTIWDARELTGMIQAASTIVYVPLWDRLSGPCCPTAAARTLHPLHWSCVMRKISEHCCYL